MARFAQWTGSRTQNRAVPGSIPGVVFIMPTWNSSRFALYPVQLYPAPNDRDEPDAAGIAAIGGLLGVFLLIGVGFANPDIIHNAAHDARHAHAFPCH